MEKYRELEQVIPDTLFPSDNDADIPTLLADMQAQDVTVPFLQWGEQRRTKDLGGTGSLHFYTEDYKFRTVYDKPAQILRANPRNIVEPNYTVTNDMPFAFAIQRIYKKRWIARAMQEHGIRVFADLNVGDRYYRTNMLGIPIGWRAFATRGCSERLDALDFEYKIACDWANGAEPLFVVYGGGQQCHRFATTHPGCIYVGPTVQGKRNLKELRSRHDGTAFLGEEFSIANLEKMTPWDRQLDAYRPGLARGNASVRNGECQKPGSGLVGEGGES